MQNKYNCKIKLNAFKNPKPLTKMTKDEEYVLKHELVPKHTKMSEKAANDLLKKYNIEKEQLPKILATDPQAKELGVKVGDIIEIERKSYTAGKTKYYRVVADA